MDLGTNLCGKTNHAIVTHIYELYQTTCEKPITNTEKTSSLSSTIDNIDYILITILGIVKVISASISKT